MLQETPITAASAEEVKPIEVVSNGVVKRGDYIYKYIYIYFQIKIYIYCKSKTLRCSLSTWDPPCLYSILFSLIGKHHVGPTNLFVILFLYV